MRPVADPRELGCDEAANVFRLQLADGDGIWQLALQQTTYEYQSILAPRLSQAYRVAFGDLFVLMVQFFCNWPLGPAQFHDDMPAVPSSRRAGV